MPDTAQAKAELDAAQAAYSSWQARGAGLIDGSPAKAAWQFEGAAIQARLDAATSALFATAAPPTKAALDAEADARFWAQTGYKPGQKLDAHDVTDRQMAKVWTDVRAKVQAEADAGTIAFTYDSPRVKQLLADAAVAHKAAVAHVDAAVRAPDPQARDQNAAAAAQAMQVAAIRAKQAAALQPPVASPQVADAAATSAHHARGTLPTLAEGGTPKQGVVVYPVGHPASPHPATRHLAQVQVRMPDQPLEPPTTADEHVALAQANGAASHAADVHEAAKKLTGGQIAGIGAAIAAALGLVLWAWKGKMTTSGRPAHARAA